MAHVEIIEGDDADGILGREYARAQRRTGRIYQVLRVQSQRPEALRDAVRLYLSVMQAPGDLTRPEREMLAVVVSAENECHY